MKPLNLLFEPFNFCPLKCCSCPQGRRELDLDSEVLKPSDLLDMLQIVAEQALRLGKDRMVKLFGRAASEGLKCMNATIPKTKCFPQPATPPTQWQC